MKMFTFVLSLITQDNDYQIEQAASAEDAARRLGLHVRILFADNDAIQQSQQLLKIIQSNSDPLPDGILIESAGGTALPHVARAAATAGIAWVVLNRDVDYTHELRTLYQVPIFSVASDNREIGRIQAKQLKALLPTGGTVLYIQGPSDSASAKPRSEGILEAKPLDIQLKVIKGQWTEASAYKAIQAWLRLSTSHQSHIDVIAAQNDAMAMGARKAFQEVANLDARDRWLSLPYIGCDGVPKTGQAWVKNGTLAATIITPPLAGKAIEMLTHALNTGIIPPNLTLMMPSSLPTLEALGARNPKTNAASTGKL